MDKQSGIYIIRNTAIGKVYIGSAKNLKQRIGEHLRRLKRNDHENKHIQRSWNKYPCDNFEFDVLEYCSPESLIKTEQQYIDEYKKNYGWRKMFNMNPSASSRFGSPVSDATRLKMSQNNSRHFLGKRHTEESKWKMRKSSLGQVAWNVGIPLLPETKKKIAIANSIRCVSSETRKKLSMAMTGRIVSDETKEKLKKSSRFKGKSHTRETKRKISDALKGRYFSEETRKKISDGVKRAIARRLYDNAQM